MELKSPGLALAVVSLAVPLGLAQSTHEDRPGHEEDTYVPRGGYLRTNKLLRMRRNAAERGLAARRFPTYQLRGSRSLPVICVSFSNVDGPRPAAELEQRLFGGAAQPTDGPTRTMTQYYRDASHGNLLVTGQVFGWYPLPGEDTYYENGRHGDGRPFGELLELGLDAADVDVDFGQFDNDGPDGVPNSGDDDGFVDTVFFVHPESGAECGQSANIWSHSWHYSEPSYGHGRPYETADLRLDADGHPVLGDDGREEHILVEDYTIQPIVSCLGSGLIDIGVFCHEFAHALGLPDLYDRTPRQGADSRGVGNWCLMAGGSYGGDGRHSDQPSHMSAWCKYYLGWSLHTPITTSGHYSFEPVAERGAVHRVDVDGPYGSEYFLLEWRDPDWVDTVYGMRVNWDAYLPTAGLAIWHVDESVGRASADWPFAGLDAGQNDAPSRVGASKHSLVSLEQSDRQQDLEQNANPGDADDLWTFGMTFGAELAAGSNSYSIGETGIRIFDIDPSTRTFWIEFPDPSSRAAPARAPIPQLAAAPRNPLPQAAAPIRPELRRVVEAYSANGLQALSQDDREVLAEAGEAQWGRFLNVGNGAALRRQLKARQETAVIEGGDASEPRLRVLAAIQDPGQESVTVEYRMTSGGDRLESLHGLWFDRTEQDLGLDARGYLARGLAGLVGEQVTLGLDTARVENSRVTFEQVLEYEGSVLPIFGAETSLYYGRDATRLVALESTALDTAALVLTGSTEAMSADSAERIVEQVTETSLAERADPATRMGIYVLGPESGRVSYEVEVPAGAGREPIRVYVDASTGRILEIE